METNCMLVRTDVRQRERETKGRIRNREMEEAKGKRKRNEEKVKRIAKKRIPARTVKVPLGKLRMPEG